ncbi:hypothetical protein QE369_000795 [Agrobacterium larrymoorei]|uniref:N utilization substance protein B n=1 Tax=Agrobacterium larrymoorei TaxID=160699 RepID=A0AAJ2ETP9_9HYPH|nr:hypothetical protein [Agrobacterium larrymoorei]
MTSVENGAEPRQPSIKPVNQRGAARLAAVQALYQMDVGGTGVTLWKWLPNMRRIASARKWMARPI